MDCPYRTGGRRAVAWAFFLGVAASHNKLDARGNEDRIVAVNVADDVCEGTAECNVEALALRQLRGVRRHTGEAFDGLGPHGGPGPLPGEVDIEQMPVAKGLQDAWVPWSAELAKASTAPLFTFYMYRAVSNEVYRPINVNAANLPGVLWYLHHEVVGMYPRKFRIRNIERFKVQVRATEPLWQKGMNFGPRLAMDRGQATGPFVCGREKAPLGNPQPMFCVGELDMEKQADILPPNGKPYKMPFEYGRYGFNVGCNKLGDFPYPQFEVYYPDATWYTLPGACPFQTFDKTNDACAAATPGGFCHREPTGAGDCTWNYEYMGRLSIDKLVDVPVDQLHWSGGREYDPDTDKGIKTSFWDGINDTAANERRIQRLRDVFAREFPHQQRDEDMPSPPCDFNMGAFYQEFWYKAPFSGKCQNAVPGDECYKMMHFGKTTGIYSHPEWYPGLSRSSTLKDFQEAFFMQNKTECPYRPCGILAGEDDLPSSSSMETKPIEGSSSGGNSSKPSNDGDTNIGEDMGESKISSGSANHTQATAGSSSNISSGRSGSGTDIDEDIGNSNSSDDTDETEEAAMA